jgi:laminin, alpha 1/2
MMYNLSVDFAVLQVYQVAYVIVKAANSPRPGQWVLERSIDGTQYSPWLYFAMTDSDCWNMFGVMPSVGVPRYKSDDEVICTSAFSQLDPLENGEVMFFID